MRTFRDAACLLVAAASVALAAWQPVLDTDRTEADAAAPAGVAKQLDDGALPKTDRTVANVPRLKA